MSNIEDSIQAFWQSYLDSLPAGQARPGGYYEVFSFCDNEADADALAQLVLQGVKTATSSLVWGYAASGEPMPAVGNLSIVTNWAKQPLCVIETLEAQVKPYDEVDAGFAYDEGEGDRSLANWRNAHWNYFGRECLSLDRQVLGTMPVLCERFRVVYP